MAQGPAKRKKLSSLFSILF
jgi:hypothetical protein